jgi:hypothetical protein
MKKSMIITTVVDFISLLIVSALLRGWVLTILWKWFIVPQFNVVQLETGYAIGIMLIWEFISSKGSYKDNSNDDDRLDALIKSVVVVISVCGLALLFGWIITLFL